MSNNTITIDGVEYVKKDSVKTTAKKKKGMEYVVVRTYSAGVHSGYIQKKKGKEVTLVESRRLYYWEGAFTCSELALNGVSKPDSCKFAPELPLIELTEAIEVIPATEKARVSLQSVENHTY